MSVDWDDVTGASHYSVRWRVAGPGNKLSAGVEVQSSDANITVDDYGEWIVRVQACNSTGCGSPVTSRFEVEPGTEPTPEPTPEPAPEPTPEPTPEPIVGIPAKPTGLQADTQSGSLNVSLDWDDITGASHYLVRWRVAGPGNTLNNGVEVQSSDANIIVDDYGEWVVRVEACGSADCGSPATSRFEVEPATESTPDPTPVPIVGVPAQPTGLQTDTQSGSLDVSLDWDDVTGASHYLVRWRVAGPGNTLNTGVEVQSSNASIAVDDYGEWVVRVQACGSEDCGSPVTSRFEVKPITGLAPFFSLAIGGLSLTEGEEIAEDALSTLPEAEGGDGELAYSLTPALPEGLSFDAETRAITGTPAEAGEFEMTYTATDEDGDEASFGFTITIGPALRTARSTNTTPITLSVSPDSFPENATGVEITVTATRQGDTGQHNVTLSLSGGTATEGTHYTVSPSTLPVLQINSGLTTASTKLTFAGIPDIAVDGDKTITISGTAPGGTVTGADITIQDAVVKPGTPLVTRTKSSVQMNPALDVKWTAPTNAGDAITGYKAQYRKQGAASWTAYTGTLSAATTSLNLTNLEAGATYEAQVRAVRGTTDGPWSDTGSGRANRAPTRTLTGRTQGQQVDVPWGGTDDIHPIGKYFADADGDTLTFVATTAHPGIIRLTIEGDDSDKKLRIHFLNPVEVPITFGAHDGYGGYSEDWLTINPIANLDRNILENSPAGTLVGDPVTGTPYNGAALSYTLAGNQADTEPFAINAETGQISLAEGASLDYETDNLYYVDVQWTVQGKTAAADVTINVTDVGPGKPDTPTVTRTQFSGQSDPALDVTWTAPDANGFTITGYEAQYRKSGLSKWERYTGTLSATATSLNLPNLEVGVTYEVQVRAISGGKEPGPWSDTGSGAANTPPKLTALGTLNPAYNLPWGGDDSVQTISGDFADADGDTLTYSASSAHPGVLTAGIEGDDADTLRIHVLNPATTKVTYGAHDGYGGYVSQDIDVSGFKNVTWSIVENSGGGTAVGSPLTGTPLGTETLSYTLTGDAASAFSINSSTGQVSVKQGATLDYETKKSYTGRVNWTVQGQAAYVDLTINVLHVLQVSNLAVTRKRFDEHSNNLDHVPALDITWTTSTNSITKYNYRFRKKGDTTWTSRNVTAPVLSFGLISLEPGAVYQVQVQAEAGSVVGPWSAIAEGRANRPPNTNPLIIVSGDVHWGAYRYADAISDHFSDADGDTLRYWVSSQYPGVIKAGLEDRDPPKLWALAINPGPSIITYGARDDYGGYVSRTFTATGVANVTRSVPENSPGGTAVGRPVKGTAYGDETLTHTLGGEAATSGAFEINSTTGQISVKQGATLDYDTKSSYKGTVTWTVQGQTATANVIINVTEVVPGKPGTPTVTRTEFSEPTAPALDVTWTAAAANGLTITGYEAQYRKQAAEGETPAAWTAYTGTLGATATTFNLADLEEGATYEAQVRAVSSDEGAGPWSDTGSGQANRAPTATSAPFLGGTFPVGSIADYNETGTGALGVLFTDADGDALTYSASAQHPALLGVSLSGAAGEAQLRVTLLNQGSSKVTYTASDPYGGSVTRTVTIGITAKESRSIAENSPTGTAVGDPVTGTPYNGVALSYTLTGEATDAFVIDSSTGQISVKEGATLDHETKNSYTGKVAYTVDGHAAVINLTINVTEVVPGKPGTPTVTRTEFSEPTAPALDVTWTAAAANGLTITGYEAQYRKKAAEGEDAAEWTAYSGTLGATASTFNIAGLEAGATYEAQVRAVSSDEKVGPWSDTGSGGQPAAERDPVVLR